MADYYSNENILSEPTNYYIYVTNTNSEECLKINRRISIRFPSRQCGQ